MSGPTVGHPAPSFKLPSAQGPEFGLEDYRGKKNVIVWFSKGMACVFCRQHMSQLARAYDEIKKRDAEVIEIAPSTAEKGRLYASKYKLPFPYLCDPEDEVRQSWDIELRKHGPVYWVGAAVISMSVSAPGNEFGKVPKGLAEYPKLVRDDDMGFFIVDKRGVIRYALGGSYVTPTGMRQIPSTDEILRELDRCAQPAP